MTKTTLTPREIDAALATAIGCSVEWRPLRDGGHEPEPEPHCVSENHRHHVYAHNGRWLVDYYYSAPTWETAGQLIEWFGSRPQDGLTPHRPQRFFDDYLNANWWYSNLTPQRIAEAARLALGIEAAD